MVYIVQKESYQQALLCNIWTVGNIILRDNLSFKTFLGQMANFIDLILHLGISPVILCSSFLGGAETEVNWMTAVNWTPVLLFVIYFNSHCVSYFNLYPEGA